MLSDKRAFYVTCEMKPYNMKVYFPHASSPMGTVIPVYQNDYNSRFIVKIYVKRIILN